MLRWQHTRGTKAAHFERLLGRGQRVPAGFANRPDILPGSAFYWAAFCDLESERSIGMAAGPIPRSKARDYALEHGIDDRDDLVDFLQVIMSLDNAASEIRRPRDADESEYSDKVSMKDAAGVKNMVRNLGRKRKQ